MVRRPVTVSSMGIKFQNLKHIVTASIGAAFALCLCAIPLAAEQNVKELMERLKMAAPSEVAPIERALELEWSKSGSTALDLLLRRGRAALENQDIEAALDHLTALTDHAPDFAEGWHARATAYYQLELFGPAVDDLQRALALNPDNYDAIFGLGAVFLAFEDHQRAARAFGMVLDLHPHHENATKALEQLKSEGIGQTL